MAGFIPPLLLDFWPRSNLLFILFPKSEEETLSTPRPYTAALWGCSPVYASSKFLRRRPWDHPSCISFLFSPFSTINHFSPPAWPIQQFPLVLALPCLPCIPGEPICLR